jgi:hypothetical protein
MGENWFAYVVNNPVNWIDPWGLSVSDGQKDNNTAVSTGFHIPGLFLTSPKVNVTNSKALNYGIAVGASALNLVSSVGNFVLSGVAYANTLVDKTIDIADKYVPSWLTLNGSVRSDIPAFEFAIAVVAPEITLYNEVNKIYYQLKSAADAAEKIIPLTKSRFGHTFTEHGANTNVEYLKYRAKGIGNPIGQFLDDQAAARFIEENIKKTANGAVTLPIPEKYTGENISSGWFDYCASRYSSCTGWWWCENCISRSIRRIEYDYFSRYPYCFDSKITSYKCH